MVRLLVPILIAAVALPAGLRAQSLPTAKALPTALAIEAAEAAIAACTAQGYRISVTIVERSGATKLFLRGDGSGAQTIESSRRKAFTAAAFGGSTLELEQRVRALPDAGAAFRGIDPGNMLVAGGGAPVKAGDEVIAGLGVGGSPGFDKDQACADAGVARIRDRLN